jgi:L-threonylcarbamoyladenylate synthase
MDFSSDIENCLNVLRNGGLILYPTDTIWGIGCDATNAEAVEKIYAVKERPSNKSLIILVADEREVLQYVANPDLQVFDYLENAGKPTTVIYENAIGLADNLVGEDGSIAIRIVKDEFCRHLIKRFRKPIVSTSANFSDQPSPKNFRDIDDQLKNAVDYVVQYRQTDMLCSTSSAIIHWKEGKPIVIRS